MKNIKTKGDIKPINNLKEIKVIVLHV